MNTQALLNEKEQQVPSWHMRVVEGGMIFAMALYYLVANPNIHIGSLHLPLQTLNPLYSLPFLVFFAVLCWYHFPVAIALLPLALPYCDIQKNVTQSLHFNLPEITLYTCLGSGL